MSAYLPIAEHGVIGDLHSVALVGTDGTIDWFCCPRFDSPSVFASILDAEKGGFYRIAPVNGGHTVRQLYFPDTNVLITRFMTPDGVGEVHDFMPIHRDPRHPRRIVRQVVAVRGEMRFRLECRPRFDYARQVHEVELYEGGAVFNTPALSLTLATNVPLERDGDDITAHFDLAHGASATFLLQPNTRGQKLKPISECASGGAGSRTPSTRAAGGRW
jgi:GH15 family glucan-1,4-alpha-glucosidase